MAKRDQSRPISILSVFATIMNHSGIALITPLHKKGGEVLNNYPVIASKHRDIRENHPQYCFFYPIEEYDYV
jgi:hypothetical protein